MVTASDLSTRKTTIRTPLTPLLAWDGWQWLGLADKSSRDEEQVASSPVISRDGLLAWWPWVWAMVLAVFWWMAFTSSSSRIGVGLIGMSGLTGIDIFLRWFLSKKTGRSFVLPSFSVIDGWVLAWVASAVIAACWSSIQPESWIGLAKILLLVLGYGVARWVWFAYPKLLTWQVLVWLALGLYESYHGWLQVTGTASMAAGPLATWQDPSLDVSQKLTRIVGTLKPLNPNLLAGALIPLSGLALASIGWVWLWLADSRTRFFAALGTGIVAFIITWALVATGSRGGYLALVVMAAGLYAALGHMIFYQPQLKGWRWPRWGWVLLAVGVIALAVVGVVSSEKLLLRVTSIFTGDSSTGYRMVVYQSALEMLRDNWLVGIGPGNLTFQQVYGYYQTPGYNALAAYSVLLEIFIEQGILGIITALGLVVSVMLAGLTAMDALYSDIAKRWWVCGLWVALLGMLAYGAFDTVWYRPAVNSIWWAVLAMLVVCQQRLTLNLPMTQGGTDNG